MIFGLSLAAFAAQAATILVWGDSLSAGYGIKIEESWPSLMQAKFNAQALPYRVVNGSISGETSAGGLTRLPKALSEHKPTIVILELGANDGLRGLPVDQTIRNLTTMIEKSRKAGARVLLVGIKMPPNLGPVYTQRFNALYEQVARAQKVPWVPFLFEGFADDLTAFQSDGFHPLASTQPKMLETIWHELSKML